MCEWGGDASGNRVFPFGKSGHVASCANRGTALTLTESVIFLGRYSVAPSKALVSPMMSLNSFIKAKRTLLESTFGLHSEREWGEGTLRGHDGANSEGTVGFRMVGKNGKWHYCIHTGIESPICTDVTPSAILGSILKMCVLLAKSVQFTLLKLD